jgi:hypothetical protein
MERKRKQKSDTLVILIKALTGNRVTVDLKNDTSVSGFLDHVEDSMMYSHEITYLLNIIYIVSIIIIMIIIINHFIYYLFIYLYIYLFIY